MGGSLAIAGMLLLPIFLMLIAVVIVGLRWPGRIPGLLRDQPWIRVPLLLAIPLCFLCATCISGTLMGRSPLHALLDNLPMTGMFAFIALLPLAFRAAPEQRACAACRYALEGLDSGIARCPECGADLSQPEASRPRRILWNRRLLAAGSVLILPLILRFASWPMMGVLWWDTQLMRVLPTSSLIHDVSNSRLFTSAEWAELSTRTLSTAQRDQLAMSLLTAADAESRIAVWSAGGKWLTGALFSGQLSPRVTGAMLAQAVRVRTTLQKLPIGGNSARLCVQSELGPMSESWAGLDLQIIIAVDSPGSKHAHYPVRIDSRCALPASMQPAPDCIDFPEFDPAAHVVGSVHILLRPSTASRASIDATPMGLSIPEDAAAYLRVPIDLSPDAQPGGAK